MINSGSIRSVPVVFVALLVGALLLSNGAAWESVSAPPTGVTGRLDADVGSTAPTARAQAELPLSFEPNVGQAARAVKFLAHGPGYMLALTDQEVWFDSTGQAATVSPFRMRFVGSNPDPHVGGMRKLPGKVNYIMGDTDAWRTNIPTYARVRYERVYPGVDLVFHGNGAQLEYDFVVAPGADPGAITLDFPGARRMWLDRAGNLVISAGEEKIIQMKPVIYQQIDGVRDEIDGGYRLTRGHRAAFRLGPYDPTRPLVIDPVVRYSTFLGGESMDAGLGIAADGSGNAYVTGFTSSTAFPTTAGAFQRTMGGSRDVFVTKLNATGTALVYSTYIGGAGDEWGSGIALDSSGNAYVTGRTDSTNFPTTSGAFDRTFGGGVDAFVLKLNATGSGLAYSTYLGGSGFEHDRDNILIVRAAAIDVTDSGTAFVTGQTTSADFPTVNAIDSSHGGGSCPGGNLVCSDVYVTKLNTSGSALVYSTFLGGNDEDAGRSIFVDASGNAYLAGTAFGGFPITPGAFRPSPQGFEGFVSKVNAAGSALAFSTFIGGELSDEALGVTADSFGNAYVTGSTTSFAFPTTPGAFQTSKIGNEPDAFVTKLNPMGSALVYSTYLGERETDEGVGIAVDGQGNAYVAGHSQLGQPVLPCRWANFDAFSASLNAAGSALTSRTCLGGQRDEFAAGMALDPGGNTYVTGRTASSGIFSTSPFPTTTGAFQTAFAGGATDAFVFKVGEENGGCTVTGTEGNDTLTGTSEADVICGLGGADTIQGLAGNDTLLGGAGPDRLFGGAGNDTLNGEGGSDTAMYSTAPSAVTVDLAAGSAGGGDGMDSLVAVENAIGSRFADTITGNAGPNKLTGSGGNDNLDGRAGNDTLRGGDGTDALKGGDGNDVLKGETGNDQLDGNAGTDNLDGGSGTDTCVNGETVLNCE